MRGVVTTGPNQMELVDDLASPTPGPGEVLVRPETVGLCGSDFHLFLGEGLASYPIIQGHEFSAIVEAVGRDVDASFDEGSRVAVWPLRSCGHCYPCSIDRDNCCEHLDLVGVMRPGALQERLVVPAGQVFACSDLSPTAAAFVEPVSVAVQAVWRANVVAGERVVVLGAGPIGQATALMALDAGARVMMVDPVAHRRDVGVAMGAELTTWGPNDELTDAVRSWTDGAGPPVVIDTTASPTALAGAVDMVARAGRVVVVGLSDAPVAFPLGRLPHKELDVLGSSCCTAAGFAKAIEVVRSRAADVESLITHRFPLGDAAAAIQFAIDRPADVQKVVVDVTTT